MSEDGSRVLKLEGVHNFRDYGGYRATGGQLRRGVLWRSGQHAEASDADLASIDSLGLRAVIDLRTHAERARMPSRRAEGCAARVIVSQDAMAMPASGGEAMGLGAAGARPRTAEGNRDRLRHAYGEFPFRPPLVAVTRRYLAELAECDGPSVIHCLAGKDRTGYSVAMVLAALGVHRDDVMEDYLLTNTAGDSEARIEAGRRSIQAIWGDMEDAALRALMAVEPEYLAITYAVIDEQYGSLEAYLETVLGADGALREKLVERLVEKV